MNYTFFVYTRTTFANLTKAPNLTMLHSKEIKEIVDEYICNNSFDYSPQELYEPLDYIIKIGGKRLRPVALLLANQLFDGEINQALPAAYAIELFHNFSLIHDDIMDAAPLRRGNETVHTKWDTNTAILSGDAMLIYSYQYLNQTCTAENAKLINDAFSSTAIKVCEGQQMDVNFETSADVIQEDYITMIYKKTGALIEGAMRIGAMLAKASSDDVDNIGAFAKQIGISFQLQDDILDAFGKKASVGKQIGGDIIQNKKTILYLLAKQHGNSKQVTELDRLFSDINLEGKEKVDKVMGLFRDIEVEEKASDLRDLYHKSAFKALEAISVPGKVKKPLIDFVDQLLVRTF